MKNFKLRRLLAVVLALALVITTCGIGTVVFANTTAPTVVNNGDGTGNNTGELNTYTTDYVADAVNGGTKIEFTATADTTAEVKGTFGVDSITDYSKITAISMYVEIPDLGSDNYYKWQLGLNANTLVFLGKYSAIDTNGQIVAEGKGSDGPIAFKNGFKGTIFYIMPKSTENVAKTTAVTKMYHKVLGKDYDFPANSNFKMDAIINALGGIKSIHVNAQSQVSAKDQKVCVDSITYHYGDPDELLESYVPKLEAPVLSEKQGLVAMGTELKMTAAAGASIYYTLDGSDPTDASTPYTAPITINAATVVKAIAYKDDLISDVVTASYNVLDANYPNVTILNDGTSNIGQDSAHEGVNAKTEFVDGYSPYGTAAKYTGMGTSGASMWNVKVKTQVPAEELAIHDAFGFWVSVPYGTELTFGPCINNEPTKYNGKVTTFNTATGEVTEYATASDAKLNGFEGYVFYDLKNAQIGLNYNKTKISWSSFLTSNNLSSLVFYHVHNSMNGKTFYFDNVVAVLDLDKFITELKAEARRPIAPGSDLAGGIVKNGENIELVTTEGADIYYTLDGTTPTTESAKYSAENMPTITVSPTTLKAIAVINGVSSYVTEFNYSFLDPSLPNTHVINAMDDTASVYNSVNGTEQVVVPNAAYYGDAMSVTGVRSGSGATLLIVKNTNTDLTKEVMAVKESVAFWVSIPIGAEMGLRPCFNGEPNPLQGKVTTYNTSTGEILEYEAKKDAVLTGFEGFIIYDLTGAEAVRDGYVPKEGPIKYKTWRKAVTDSGLTKFEFYLRNSTFFGKTFVIDDIMLVTDTAKFIDEIKALPLRPVAPVGDIPGGTVKANEKVTLSAQEGCEIYYTTDGTEPSKTNGTLFSAEAPIVITTEPTTIKAIAYKGDMASMVVTYEYNFLRSDFPNVTVINPADDVTKITNSIGASEQTIAENFGYYGNAMSVKGTMSGSGASLLSVKNTSTAITPAEMAVAEALSYWVSVPIGTTITLNPCITEEKHPLKTSATTYNTNTGEVKNYEVGETLELDGFEGFLIFDLKGNCVRATWSNDGAYYTWREFVTSNGLSDIEFYMTKNTFFNRTFILDDMSLVMDKEAFLAEIATLEKRPIAPASEIAGGIVKSGEKIPFETTPGAEIYYTIDGSEPTKENGILYNGEAMPVIETTNTVIKAVSYLDGKYSKVVTYTYEFLGADVPNATIINDLDNIESVLQMATYGERTDRDHNNVMSPYGYALTVTGKNPVNTGSLMAFKNEDTTISANQLAAHNAFAYWVSVPAGTTMSFTPRFNGEQYVLKAPVVAYNTSTGEVTEFAVGQKPEFNGFEGFLIYKLEGDCVRTKWSEDSYVSWRKFVTSNGVDNITFYYNDKAIYKQTFTLDRFTMIVDVDKFVEELKTQPLRPLPPTADPGSDAVKENTQIFLHAAVDSGVKIVYTLDGTIPTVDANGNITNGKEYVTYSMGNGQEDASYIELREDTTIKAIVVDINNNQASGVATFVYTIEPPYDGPNVVVINNGTGEGKNTWSWVSDAIFTKEIVDREASPDGKAMKVTITEPSKDKSVVQEVTFKVDTTNAKQIHDAQGFAFHLTVPDLGKASLKMGFGLRVTSSSNYLNADIYAISDDGETVLKNPRNFNDFSGTVYCVIQEPVGVSMKYGAVDMEWSKFIKQNSLTMFGFYYTCPKVPEEFKETPNWYFELDDISLVYDTDKLFKDINLDGLLATYDAGTFENTNMIVTNDGSGNAKNVGLYGFSDNLVIEKTNYSFDERSLKLTMPEGESFINFMGTSEHEELVIGDGVAFWVEMPEGEGSTVFDVALYDNAGGQIELYDYADRWYYLIDKYGVISKHEGELAIPAGFRGWIVIPKVAFFLTEEDGYTIVNAELNFEQVSNIITTFRNKNGELTGKTVHIDDISFYTDFTKLVQSRAIKWEGQVLE